MGIIRSPDKSHLESDAKNIQKKECWWWKLSGRLQSIHRKIAAYCFVLGGNQLKSEWTLETKDVLMKRSNVIQNMGLGRKEG